MEDFGGLQYERVWLYVNGRLAASGGPGTDAAAKCGGEVAAVVKYHSGTKKLEGRILCTKPVKAPSGGKWDIYSVVMLEAYRVATGDLERTSLPIKITGEVGCGGGDRVTFMVASPHVVLCYYDLSHGIAKCRQSLTFEVWRMWQPIEIYIYKMPEKALAAQYFGGAHAFFVVTQVSDGVYHYLYVNGSLMAKCRSEYEYESYTVDEYERIVADGLYMTELQLPDGRVVHGTLAIWQRPDGSWGFQTWLNPTNKPPTRRAYR